MVKVPLVLYAGGDRQVIGEAEVGPDWSVKATVTHPLAKELGFEQGPFSIYYGDDQPLEAGVMPDPAVQLMNPRYKEPKDAE